MTCVIDGCKRTVPPPFCICNECFKLLPAPLRTELTRSFNPHLEIDEQAPGFHTARAKVHSWIRETLGGEDRRQHKSWAQLVEWVRARDAARACRGLDKLTCRGVGDDHSLCGEPVANLPVARVVKIGPLTSGDEEDPQPAPPAQMELL